MQKNDKILKIIIGIVIAIGGLIVLYNLFMFGVVAWMYFHIDTDFVRILNNTEKRVTIRPIFEIRNVGVTQECPFSVKECNLTLEPGQSHTFISNEAWIEYVELIETPDNIRYFCQPPYPAPDLNTKYKGSNLAALKDILTKGDEIFTNEYSWSAFVEIFPEKNSSLGDIGFMCQKFKNNTQ